ncbi:MAG: choice-of-anchor D domain-containing protein, partial [Myxococcota bacterium]
TTLNPPADGNPGGSIAIPVSYAPETLGDDAGVLIVETDNADPIRGRIEVPLQGSGGGPRSELSPRSDLEFGRTAVDGASRRDLLLSNLGFQDLSFELTIVGPDASVFSVDRDLGTTIDPGTSVFIRVVFEPEQPGAHQATLILRTNERDGRQEIILTGEAVILPFCRPEALTILSLGPLQALTETSARLDIRNLSFDAPCLLNQVELSPVSDPAFELEQPELPLFIEPNTRIGLDLRVAPTTLGSQAGRVEFTVSNAEEPFRAIDLVVSTHSVVPFSSPRALDFGTVATGCAPLERSLHLVNASDAALTIDELRLEGDPSFSLPSPPERPLTLPPASHRSVTVRFAPNRAIGSRSARLRFEGRLGDEAFASVGLVQAMVDSFPVQVDGFRTSTSKSLDLLVLIEDSPSMNARKEPLEEGFRRLIGSFEGRRVAYQVGTAGMTRGEDAGLLRPLDPPISNRVVVPLTRPSPQRVLATNVTAILEDGIGRVGTRIPLDAAYKALSPSLVLGDHDGFLRREAELAVLVVVDERDGSFVDVDFMERFLLAWKGGDRSRVSFSVLAGGSNPCPGVDEATRLIDLAQRLGGEVLELCGDIPNQIEAYAEGLAQDSDRFPVAHPAVADGMVVALDGELLPEDEWRFDVDEGVVVLDQAPEAGVELAIQYERAECSRPD